MEMLKIQVLIGNKALETATSLYNLFLGGGGEGGETNLHKEKSSLGFGPGPSCC